MRKVEPWCVVAGRDTTCTSTHHGRTRRSFVAPQLSQSSIIFQTLSVFDFVPRSLATRLHREVLEIHQHSFPSLPPYGTSPSNAAQRTVPFNPHHDALKVRQGANLVIEFASRWGYHPTPREHAIASARTLTPLRGSGSPARLPIP